MDHLSKHPQVEYVVGRPFTYEGVAYQLGEDFPNRPDIKTEVLVRGRFLVPVTDDVDSLPRYPFRGVVKTRELAYLKLKVQDPRVAAAIDAEPVEPVEEVVEEVVEEPVVEETNELSDEEQAEFDALLAEEEPEVVSEDEIDV